MGSKQQDRERKILQLAEDISRRDNELWNEAVVKANPLESELQELRDVKVILWEICERLGNILIVVSKDLFKDE